MGVESTITEQDMDDVSRQFVQGIQSSGKNIEADLDVDGLSDSMVVRLKRFLLFGRS